VGSKNHGLQHRIRCVLVHVGVVVIRVVVVLHVGGGFLTLCCCVILEGDLGDSYSQAYIKGTGKAVGTSTCERGSQMGSHGGYGSPCRSSSSVTFAHPMAMMGNPYFGFQPPMQLPMAMPMGSCYTPQAGQVHYHNHY
jgi:hypothetical protein